MTLASLAEMMGVTASAVTQYLKSENLSLGTLMKFSEVLGVKLDDLVLREECKINGFVDVDGFIYRINTKDDVARLLADIEAKTPKAVSDHE